MKSKARASDDKRIMSFEEACAIDKHRFTMEYIPQWHVNCGGKVTNPKPHEVGHFYAPAYRTDREWYDNSRFAGEAGGVSKPGAEKWDHHRYDLSWPLGVFLTESYTYPEEIRKRLIRETRFPEHLKRQRLRLDEPVKKERVRLADLPPPKRERVRLDDLPSKPKAGFFDLPAKRK